MEILVPKQLWNMDKEINSFSKKEYWKLNLPVYQKTEKYLNYVVKIPENLIEFKNGLPFSIRVWDEFIFDFEKEKKEQGKKHKHLKLTVSEFYEIMEQTNEEKEYILVTYPDYDYDVRGNSSKIGCLNFNIGFKSDQWFIPLDSPSDRKNLKAKNIKIISRLSMDEKNKYLQLKKELNKKKKIISSVNTTINKVNYDYVSMIRHLSKEYNYTAPKNMDDKEIALWTEISTVTRSGYSAILDQLQKFKTAEVDSRLIEIEEQLNNLVYKKKDNIGQQLVGKNIKFQTQNAKFKILDFLWPYYTIKYYDGNVKVLFSEIELVSD